MVVLGVGSRSLAALGWPTQLWAFGQDVASPSSHHDQMFGVFDSKLFETETIFLVKSIICFY